MNVKIKCKCGKTLRVPPDLANKKVSCPGCRKCYRVSPETFAQAAPRFQGGRPIPSQPASLPSVPLTEPDFARTAAGPEHVDFAPLELDITPSQIDLLAGVSLSSSDMSDDLKLAGESAPAGGCPACHAPVAPGAVICVKCGTNLQTGRKVGGADTPASTVAYAAAPSHPRLRDEPAGPKRGYWADALRSFFYPVHDVGSAVSFCIVLGVLLLQIPMKPLISFGTLGLASLAAVFGICVIKGWAAALYLNVVTETAGGKDDLPGIRMEDGVLDDAIIPGLKYVGAYACALGPAAIYLIGCATDLVPLYMQSGVALLLWIAGGIFFWPMFVLLFAFSALLMLIRVDLIITTVFRTLLPYLSLWLLLLLVGVVNVFTIASPLVAQSGVNVPIPQFDLKNSLGQAAYVVVETYLTVVAMRQIGLYYLHFKKRFTLIFE